MDPVYGYESVNVEAQSRSLSSLLSATKRLIAVRKSTLAFGRGTMTFIRPENRSVLCYVRQYQDEVILCVANLSRSAQATELDLSAWKDRIPLEMLGRTRFPAIGELPYMITLAPYGFYWFELQERDKSAPVRAARGARVRDAGGAAERDLGLAGARARRVRARRAAGTSGADALVSGAIGQGDPADAGFGGSVLRHRRQPAVARVFRDDATRRHHALRAADADRMGALRPRALQSACACRRAPGRARRHAARCGDRPDLHRAAAAKPARIPRRRGRRTGTAAGIQARPAASPTSRCGSRSASVRSRPSSRTARRWSTKTMSSRSTASWKTASTPRSRWAASSPTSWASPTRRPCSAASELVDGDKRSAIGIVHSFVANQGDAWVVTSSYLDRFVDEQRLLAATDHPGESEEQVPYLRYMSQAGRRTGEMHIALAGNSELPEFVPEPTRPEDVQRWIDDILLRAERVADTLRQRRDGAEGSRSAAGRPAAGAAGEPAGSPRRDAAARDRRSQHPPSRRSSSRADC